jgi:hypothetical protein
VWVVKSAPFKDFSPCNHIIDIKKKSFSGEAKDSAIFPPFFLHHKRAKPAPSPTHLNSLPISNPEVIQDTIAVCMKALQSEVIQDTIAVCMKALQSEVIQDTRCFQS